MLQPFVVASWHGVGEKEMPDDVKEAFAQSGLGKDPKRLNVFALILDAKGNLVHGFHGLPGQGGGRSDYKEEIARAVEKLELPQCRLRQDPRPPRLPDLRADRPGAPSGVRIFVRPVNERGGLEGRQPIVELVAMQAEDWKPLAYPEKPAKINAEALRSWLVQLYPPAVRTADQSKPFRTIDGKLTLEPAGSDKEGRYAILHGTVQLAKGDETESAFEGKVALVLKYRADAVEVAGVRGVVEGEYLYRIRGTQRIPLKAAIESRPE